MEAVLKLSHLKNVNEVSLEEECYLIRKLDIYIYIYTGIINCKNRNENR